MKIQTKIIKFNANNKYLTIAAPQDIAMTN